MRTHVVDRGVCRFTVSNSLARLSFVTLLVVSVVASSATLEGRVVNIEGDPLPKVNVCLALISAPEQCHKSRLTNKHGEYSFRGLKTTEAFVVRVHTDTSAANRKNEIYRTYVWAPQQQVVELTARADNRLLPDFLGKFNFSNFQRILVLTATDFPELASIDVNGSYVVLKVFLPPEEEGQASETIFLGQLTNTDTLRIDASVPQATRAIAYEIFSATLSLSGSIPLLEL